MSSRALFRATSRIQHSPQSTHSIPSICVFTRQYNYLLHRFNGYKYTGHYSNIKTVDPNLERYSPLMLIPRKGYNRFSTSQSLKDSIPLQFTAVALLSVVLTGLCFTEKDTWESYKVANKIFYYAFKPFMEIMAFTLNLNVQGPKIEVPDKIAYHRDSDCNVITNLDFATVPTEEESSQSVNDDMAEEQPAESSDVEPIQPINDQ